MLKGRILSQKASSEAPHKAASKAALVEAAEPVEATEQQQHAVQAIEPTFGQEVGPRGSGTWVCRHCGFFNRASNTQCGGFGPMGCNADREVAPSDGPVALDQTLVAPQTPPMNDGEASMEDVEVEEPEEATEQQEHDVQAIEPASGPETGPRVPAVWFCRHCGFRNRPTNTQCGGFGPMGCNAGREIASSYGPVAADKDAPGAIAWQQPSSSASSQGKVFFHPDTEAKLDRWVQAKRQKMCALADRIAAELQAIGVDPDSARPPAKEPASLPKRRRNEAAPPAKHSAEEALDMPTSLPQSDVEEIGRQVRLFATKYSIDDDATKQLLEAPLRVQLAVLEEGAIKSHARNPSAIVASRLKRQQARFLLESTNVIDDDATKQLLEKVMDRSKHRGSKHGGKFSQLYRKVAAATRKRSLKQDRRLNVSKGEGTPALEMAPRPETDDPLAAFYETRNSGTGDANEGHAKSEIRLELSAKAAPSPPKRPTKRPVFAQPAKDVFAQPTKRPVFGQPGPRVRAAPPRTSKANDEESDEVEAVGSDEEGTSTQHMAEVQATSMLETEWRTENDLPEPTSEESVKAASSKPTSRATKPRLPAPAKDAPTGAVALSTPPPKLGRMKLLKPPAKRPGKAAPVKTEPNIEGQDDSAMPLLPKHGATEKCPAVPKLEAPRPTGPPTAKASEEPPARRRIAQPPALPPPRRLLEQAAHTPPAPPPPRELMRRLRQDAAAVEAAAAEATAAKASLRHPSASSSAKKKLAKANETEIESSAHDRSAREQRAASSKYTANGTTWHERSNWEDHAATNDQNGDITHVSEEITWSERHKWDSLPEDEKQESRKRGYSQETSWEAEANKDKWRPDFADDSNGVEVAKKSRNSGDSKDEGWQADRVCTRPRETRGVAHRSKDSLPNLDLESPAAPGTLLVSGFPASWGRAQLRPMFTFFGVEEMTLAKDPRTEGRVALVRLKTPEKAQQVVDQVDGSEVDVAEAKEACFLSCEIFTGGAPEEPAVAKQEDSLLRRTIFVDELPMPKRPDSSPIKTNVEVFMENLPFEHFSEPQVVEWLEQFGGVDDLLFLHNHDSGELSGSGYVRFASHQDAAEFIAAQDSQVDSQISAAWSESERLLQGTAGAYAASVHEAFDELIRTAGIKDVWMLNEKRHRSIGAPSPAGKQLHFIVSSSQEEYAIFVHALSEALAAFHCEVSVSQQVPADSTGFAPNSCPDVPSEALPPVAEKPPTFVEQAKEARSCLEKLATVAEIPSSGAPPRLETVAAQAEALAAEVAATLPLHSSSAAAERQLPAVPAFRAEGFQPPWRSQPSVVAGTPMAIGAQGGCIGAAMGAGFDTPIAPVAAPAGAVGIARNADLQQRLDQSESVMAQGKACQAAGDLDQAYRKYFEGIQTLKRLGPEIQEAEGLVASNAFYKHVEAYVIEARRVKEQLDASNAQAISRQTPSAVANALGAAVTSGPSSVDFRPLDDHIQQAQTFLNNGSDNGLAQAYEQSNAALQRFLVMLEKLPEGDHQASTLEAKINTFWAQVSSLREKLDRTVPERVPLVGAFAAAPIGAGPLPSPVLLTPHQTPPLVLATPQQPPPPPPLVVPLSFNQTQISPTQPAPRPPPPPPPPPLLVVGPTFDYQAAQGLQQFPMASVAEL